MLLLKPLKFNILDEGQSRQMSNYKKKNSFKWSNRIGTAAKGAQADMTFKQKIKGNKENKMKKRTKRSGDPAIEAASTRPARKDIGELNKGVLRKTNSASALLGLSILLYPDKNEYDTVAHNNFYGFRVSRSFS